MCRKELALELAAGTGVQIISEILARDAGQQIVFDTWAGISGLRQAAARLASIVRSTWRSREERMAASRGADAIRLGRENTWCGQAIRWLKSRAGSASRCQC